MAEASRHVCKSLLLRTLVCLYLSLPWCMCVVPGVNRTKNWHLIHAAKYSAADGVQNAYPVSVNPLMQVCMYVFVCVYTCVHACIHIHVEVCLYPQTCGRVTASLFKVPTFHVFLMQNLSLIWNLLSRLSSQASEPQDPPGSVYSMMRLYSHNTMPGFWHGCWNIKLRTQVLPTKPPSLAQYSFFKKKKKYQFLTVWSWLLVLLKRFWALFL